jgi:CYTH domain-containing protein
VLGDPIPIEHEEKFVIDNVDHIRLLLDKVGKVHTTKIVQTYLRGSCPTESRRVRSRTDAGGTTYFYTTKVHIGPGKRIECERIISRGEYEALLKDASPQLLIVRKLRHVFFVDGICYELDVFDDPHKGLVYLEVELTPPLGTPDQPRTITADTLPEVFHDLRLRCVTDDPAYSNLALAIPKA